MLLVDLYYLGLFFVAAVCVYAIIYSRTNRLVTFFLIPIVLAVSVWTWQAIYALQGTPRPVLPFDEDVEVLYQAQLRPWIYALILHTKDGELLYYRIPYTEENSYKMNQIQKQIDRTGRAEGKFNEPRGSGSTPGSFFFTEIESFQDRVRKGGPTRADLEALGGLPNGF